MHEQGSPVGSKERFINQVKETALQIPTYARRLRDWVSTHKSEVAIGVLAATVLVAPMSLEENRAIMLKVLPPAIVLSLAWGFASIPLMQWANRTDQAVLLRRQRIEIAFNGEDIERNEIEPGLNSL